MTSSLNTARTGQTETLLPDGRVLVLGGYNGNGSPTGAIANAEVYGPARETIPEAKISPPR